MKKNIKKLLFWIFSIILIISGVFAYFHFSSTAGMFYYVNSQKNCEDTTIDYSIRLNELNKVMIMSYFNEFGENKIKEIRVDDVVSLNNEQFKKCHIYVYKYISG